MPINPIVLIIPDELSTLRSTLIDQGGNESLFDDDDNLRLFLLPKEYRRGTEGEAAKPIDGTTSSFVLRSARRVILEIDTVEGRLAALQMVKALAQYSADNQAALSLIDYVEPEIDDLATGYTERSGFIRSPEAKSGAVRKWDEVTSTRFNQGFRFQFVESNLREFF